MNISHFADRLFEAVKNKQSQVVVGLDPRPDLFPFTLISKKLRENGSTSEAVAESIIEFNSAVIDAVADLAVAVKCQIAFYECYGIHGLKAYSRTLDIAKKHDLVVIGDVKRNDIGSTASAYAAAHLGSDGNEANYIAPDFHVDALTVNPFFGVDGITPFIESAVRNGGGIFVLVRTSNPSSGQVQELISDNKPVYQHLASLVRDWGENHVGSSGYSLVGAVVGATFPRQLTELRTLMPKTPFLIPGFGAQGGGVEDVIKGFDKQGMGALVNSSRGLIYAYRNAPYAEIYGEERYKDAVRAAAADMRRLLWENSGG